MFDREKIEHANGDNVAEASRMSVDAIARLEQIRASVSADGNAKVVDLARRLDVSEMTIRRDLVLLEEQGYLRRVRGGAVARGPQPFVERHQRHTRAKERISVKLRDLVGDGGVIGVDASTTLQRLAHVLDQVRDLTILTNGPETFAELQGRPGVNPLLTGGRLDVRTGSLVGPLAARTVKDFSIRRLFISAAALDPELGTFESTLEDAEAKIAFADVSEHVVLAVDASKLATRAVTRCLELERIDILVTDLDPRDPRLDPFRSVKDIR